MLGQNLIIRGLVGNRLVGGTWTASGTWTLPAVTLGGAITGGGQSINNIISYSTGAGGRFVSTADNTYFTIRGGTNAAGAGSVITYVGVDNADTGLLDISTPDAAGTADSRRLRISGKTATAIAAWSAITHANLNLSDYLGLFITDTDSATEGDIWYDASEDKLKFKTAAGIETITST